jgi:hypothetical protein
MLLPLPETEPISSGDQFIAWSLYRLDYCGREFRKRVMCLLESVLTDRQCKLWLCCVITVQLVTEWQQLYCNTNCFAADAEAGKFLLFSFCLCLFSFHLI